MAELENTQEQYDREYEAAFFGEEEGKNEETVQDTETREDTEFQNTDSQVQEVLDETETEETATEELSESETEALEEDESLETEGDTEIEEQSTDEEPVRKHKLKWNGEEIEVTEEELIMLGQKGFDYTSKMQTVSKYRKSLEQAGINDDVVELMSKVQQGDKTALAQIAKMNNIDAVDLLDVEIPENEDYTPRNESTSMLVSEQVKPIIEQVRNNPELQAKMSQAEDMLPNAVIHRMAQDADLLYGAVSEIESGSFNQVMPQVQKRLATMSELDREYVLNSPDAFGGIYFEEKARVYAEPQAEQPQAREPQQAQRKKPNMAEVGVKKSNTSTRSQEVIKDAFTDDAEYQKILNKVRRF